MNIFDYKPELHSYVAKYMDEQGCDFDTACEALGIDHAEEVELESL